MSKEIVCPDCGSVIGPGGRKPRSVPHHRRFFGLISAALAHWPENHERQFTSAEELRAYLLLKAGHRSTGASIPLSGMQKERALLLVEAAIRGAGSYAMPVLQGDTLVIFTPKSIAFHALGHQAFTALNNDVEALIEQEIGVSADQLLREHERAA